MIAKQGIDYDGVPYFDDLYLDLVVYPDGTIVVDDMDELESFPMYIFRNNTFPLII